MTDGKMWKIRERGMAMGIFLWSIGISSTAAANPDSLIGVISTKHPGIIFSFMLMIFGVLCGISTVAMWLLNYWITPTEVEEFRFE